ncbi:MULTISPECIES: GtrA family protein [Turicibacter]|uniref:GtrA family protein n=2 Tax=Turicibacter sanguinis TaxID=154288 RepID=A0A173UMD2_9FIRM|nr:MULTISPECIES: GtrA family protein [Turicibacter]EFF63156.1 GtrA-like protein [Turicibacter sanguinis PC909]EGC92067.1 GtrA-like protein [Turicibacter sp. HGF1]MBP3903506.1 GtrA family protein [Turicibacter sp.]MCU7191846.1 GtrA family protein [Turicibacter sanguinis]MCU7198151.1 GtrA family protein [Turicibacter sanguinis]
MQFIKEVIRKYFIKFGLVGFVNTMIQQVIYIFLVFKGRQFIGAQTYSFTVALFCSYILNSHFTYVMPLSFKQFFHFFMANLPTYLIQILTLVILVEGLGAPRIMALFLTLSVTPFTFLLVSFSMLKAKGEG